ncbi:glycosyltransferase family 4 protein [Serratia marcescens]|uniref:glycosyltransferase family 4 protein n=1 Tax=Serratia marcescens TaxID=615 RepID=UPI00235E1131|nr:glycosyltransferase family 4 protein [Serratia marcescens]
MKVIVANTLYAPYRVGGAEVSVQILCENLVAQGHQVRVLTFHEESHRKVRIINGVEVVYLPLKNIYWPFNNERRSGLLRGLWHIFDSYNIMSRIQFGRELDIYKPDVVHTNNLAGFSVSVWSAAKKRGVKIIHTARDYYLFHPNSTLFRQGRNQNPRRCSVFAWSLLRKIQSKKVTSFIGISDFIKDFHVATGFFPLAKTNRIYNAVEVSSSSTPDAGTLRIGFIGKLSVAKGFDTFCQYVQLIKARNSEVIAIAAGVYAEEDKSYLETLAATAQITMLGRTTLPDFLAQVDVVILPTKWREPFGRTVIECALANKVILVRPVGGISELLNIIPAIIELHTAPTYDELISFIHEKRVISAQNRDLFSPRKIAQEYIAEYARVKNE